MFGTCCSRHSKWMFIITTLVFLLLFRDAKSSKRLIFIKFISWPLFNLDKVPVYHTISAVISFVFRCKRYQWLFFLFSLYSFGVIFRSTSVACTRNTQARRRIECYHWKLFSGKEFIEQFLNLENRKYAAHLEFMTTSRYTVQTRGQR